MMVDFKKLAEDMYNNSTPEERERMDAYRAREAMLNVTRREIEATFTRLEERHIDQGTGKKPEYKLEPGRVTTKTIGMRIEEGNFGEIIRFIGAVTGHEAYSLNEEFIAALTQPSISPEEEDVFSICWGSAKYERCDVSKAAVVDYLKEVRPDLFTGAPAPWI